MNKVITSHLGGHPLRLNDLGFIQDSARDQIASICKSFGADLLLMYGVVATLDAGTEYTWTKGSVYLNGELYFVDAQVVATETDNFGWKISETFENLYNRDFIVEIM